MLPEKVISKGVHVPDKLGLFRIRVPFGNFGRKRIRVGIGKKEIWYFNRLKQTDINKLIINTYLFIRPRYSHPNLFSIVYSCLSWSCCCQTSRKCKHKTVPAKKRSPNLNYACWLRSNQLSN